MPLFEFRCTTCERETELLVRVADIEVFCARCGMAMVKQPSAPAFKVNGFSAANNYSKKAGE